MAVTSDSEDGRILRTLHPLITFPSEAFKDLCASMTIESVQDAPIFKRGDTNSDFVYLLEGTVTLQAGSLIVDVINTESESAKFALAHQIPRKIDAVAQGLVRIVRLNAHTVNNPPPAVYREDLGYTVVEESEGENTDDWMSSILHWPLFEMLPATSLQKILISLRINQYNEGDVIIENGSDIESFNVVYKGQCLLTRNRAGEVNEIKLNVGDSFGEEYLLTYQTAQETVIALTDVSIIQLDKKLFLSHIKKPIIQYIEPDDVADAQKNGSILLDVRLPYHYENQHLPGSANIPLLALRMQLSQIPKDRQIIVVCANGLASEAAAYLLIKNGVNAVVLKDGMGSEEAESKASEITDKLVEQPVQAYEPGAPVKSENTTTATENADMAKVVGESGSDEPNAEYARLIQRNQELEALIATLQSEKDKAVNDCAVLTQQLERLKEILNRLTKRQ